MRDLRAHEDGGNSMLHDNKSNVVINDITNSVIEKFIADTKSLLGSKLNQVILYGSYARNNPMEDSDVDIMLLVSISNEEIGTIQYDIVDYATNLFLINDVDISPTIVNIDHFKHWENDLPFYRNVKNEGVLLYEQ